MSERGPWRDSSEGMARPRTESSGWRKLGDVVQELYRSAAWRRLRYDAIRKHGARCQACGRTPKDGITINVDHIKPLKLHPELALEPSNLQVLCNECNHGKGNRDATDWRERPCPACNMPAPWGARYGCTNAKCADALSWEELRHLYESQIDNMLDEHLGGS